MGYRARQGLRIGGCPRPGVEPFEIWLSPITDMPDSACESVARMVTPAYVGPLPSGYGKIAPFYVFF